VITGHAIAGRTAGNEVVEMIWATLFAWDDMIGLVRGITAIAADKVIALEGSCFTSRSAIPMRIAEQSQ
jgi:hypothetical protein